MPISTDSGDTMAVLLLVVAFVFLFLQLIMIAYISGVRYWIKRAAKALELQSRECLGTPKKNQ